MRSGPYIAVAALAVASCGEQDAKSSAISSDALVNPRPVETGAPPGLYTLVPEETRVSFVVEYVDLTRINAQFPAVEGSLQLDPQKPDGSVLSVRADARKVQAPPGLAQVIQSADFLDADRHPEIAFRSTRVVTTGPSTADITGDLTVRGETRPVTLKAALTGAKAPPSGQPGEAKLSFTATGTIKRGRFAMEAMMPFQGDPAGVMDEVDVRIDATFAKKVTPPMAVAGPIGSG